MSRLADLGRRITAARWTLFDVALAAVLLVTTLQQRDTAPGDWWLFATPMLAALVIRRRRPLLAVGLAMLGAIGHHLTFTATAEPLDLAVPLTLYTLAGTVRPRRAALAMLGTGLAAVAMLSVLHLLTEPTRPQPTPGATAESYDKAKLAEQARFADPRKFGVLTDGSVGKPQNVPPDPLTFPELVSDALGRAVGVMLVLGLAYAIGDGVRGRRIHVRTLEQRADDLEREQHQRVALATAAERARITRELHDVVAHGLSVMVVQAQGGAAALQRHPDRTAAALDNVISTGRASLADMRRLLDVVRDDPATDAELGPQPGIGSLPELVDRVRAAGTPVTFAIEGDPEPLPATVDLFAYRITQEALTNTIKHGGGGARAAVRLGFRREELEVEVTDDGTGGDVPPDTDGNGLRGIAERVGLLGGVLDAGPADTGGFRVRAVLPLRLDPVRTT